MPTPTSQLLPITSCSRSLASFGSTRTGLLTTDRDTAWTRPYTRKTRLNVPKSRGSRVRAAMSEARTLEPPDTAWSNATTPIRRPVWPPVSSLWLPRPIRGQSALRTNTIKVGARTGGVSRSATWAARQATALEPKYVGSEACP